MYFGRAARATLTQAGRIASGMGGELYFPQSTGATSFYFPVDACVSPVTFPVNLLWGAWSESKRPSTCGPLESKPLPASMCLQPPAKQGPRNPRAHRPHVGPDNVLFFNSLERGLPDQPLHRSPTSLGERHALHSPASPAFEKQSAGC